MERQGPTTVRRDHVERYNFARDVIEWAATKVDTIENRVLDAACGTGYGSFILAQEYPVYGIDIEPEAIATAREHFPVCEFRVGDVRDRCWNGFFKAVVSFETLEHLPNPDVALMKFKESAPILIASVPNEDVFPFNPMAFADNKYPHHRHYTPKAFEDLLELADYTVILKSCQEGKNSPVTDGTNGRTLVYVAI